MSAPNGSPRFLLPENGIAHATISAANTNRDGTGTIVDIFTAGLQGGRVELVRVQAVGTTTAGVVRLFIWNGSAWSLYKEILVTAVTPSTVLEAFSIEFVPNRAFDLPTTYKLGASTHNAEAFRVFAHGGNY